ncbi:Flp pilus assembly complex ATPase component TadA [bacterium]|nr:Flp pilus assembly complex ATPase component TadA [bacterium]
MASRLILVFGAKGGLGRSVIAGNLAVAIARRTKRATALWDLDWMGGGSQASYLDLDPPPGNWADVVRGAKALDDALAEHESGVSLLAAPPVGEALVPRAADVASIARELARDHELVVADTSFPNLGHEAMVALFDMASVVLLLVTPDITTLNASKAVIDQARALRFPLEKIHVVLNRAGSVDELGPDDITEHLERPLIGQVPSSGAVVASLNRGEPIVLKQPSHPVSAGILQLGARALAQSATNLESAAKGVLARATERPVTQAAPGPSASVAPSSAGSEVKAVVPHQAPVVDEALVELRREVHRELVEALKRFNLSLEYLADPTRKGEIREKVLEVTAEILDQLEDVPLRNRAERVAFINAIADEAVGFGPLERFLADPAVTEVMVNGHRTIYVERSGKLTRTPDTFTDEKQLRVVIDRIVAPIGRRVDESSPMCDARLPDGSRVNVIIPPLALTGSTITIRKFPNYRLGIEDLVKFGSLNQDMAHFLKCSILAKLNVFISGGTGSGKTTLLNVLSGFIPSDERIVTIEDAAELKLHQDHVISLESRPPNLEGTGAIAIRDLVRNSLRMRPDRIIVGEVRGGEALDMLQAMNTGHDGSLATGHANSPRDALSRLETMVLMGGVELPSRAIREQIASAIQIIVQISRLKDGSRKITRISEVAGMESDTIVMQDLFAYDQETVDAQGRVVGQFRYTGLVPNAADQFARVGLKFGAGGMSLS